MAAKSPPVWNQRTPPPKIAGQSKVTRPELGRCFVRPLIEDDGRPHATASVGVDRGDVRAGHAVVLEATEEGGHAGRPHARGNEQPDRVVDHCRSDATPETEAVREARRHGELSASEVDVARACSVEGDRSRGKAND